MSDKYTVVVGNIGTVYSGNSARTARKTFNEYIDQSINRYGRASGEPVYLFSDGELDEEYEPSQQEE